MTVYPRQRLPKLERDGCDEEGNIESSDDDEPGGSADEKKPAGNIDYDDDGENHVYPEAIPKAKYVYEE